MIINNFSISTFKRLIKQSLLVNDTIMMEVDDTLIKSVSFSGTKSLVKIWTSKTNDLSILSDNEEIDNVQDFKNKFNIYILNGSAFYKFLDIFSIKESAKLSINVIQTNAGYQANCLTIEGVSVLGSKIKTNYLLSVDDMLTDKVSDYEFILKQCTPEKDYHQFTVNNTQIAEIKSLIKKLHKTVPNNTTYIKFSFKDDKLFVSDNVFSIEVNYESNESDLNGLNFNILKTDFVRLEDASFIFYTNNDVNKVILGTNILNSVIWCTTLKVASDINNDDYDTEINENLSDFNDIDDLNLSEYGLS